MHFKFNFALFDVINALFKKQFKYGAQNLWRFPAIYFHIIYLLNTLTNC